MSQHSRPRPTTASVTPMRRPWLTLVLLLAGAAVGGCQSDDGSDDDLGRPCAYDGQCGGGLICDFHMGLGTCQLAHSHSGTSTSSGGESESDGSSSSG